MDFGIAVKGFIVKDNKLLILKRSEENVHAPNIWEIPGGRLKPGEDPKEGLIREVKEETGLDIEIIIPLNTHHFVRDDRQVITMIIFLCKSEDKNTILSHEHSDIEWVNIDSCKDKLSEYFHKEVDVYDEFFRNKNKQNQKMLL